MIKSTRWPESVGSIVDGETSFSADSMGVIINNLAMRTDWLKEFLDGINTSSNKSLSLTSRGFTMYDTGFSAQCKEGDLVAFDKSSGIYIPAQAIGSNTYRDDGTEIPADSATVVGLLLSLDDSTGGTVLCYGILNDPVLNTKLASEGPGDYYLSDVSPGKAVKGNYAPSQMHALCYTYLYSNNTGLPLIFVRPQPPAYNGTPEIRAVQAKKDTPMLTVETTKGVVTVGINTEIVEKFTTSGKAVAGISEIGLYSEPVINDILGGAGITVNKNDGVAIVSSSSALSSVIDLNLCSLNGVYIGTSTNNSVVYTFPAGVSASLTGSIRAPYVGDVVARGSIKILLEGNKSSSALSGLQVTVQPAVSSDSAEIPKAVPVDYTISNISTVSSESLYELKVDLIQDIPSNALIYVKLSSTNPAVATKVVSVSLELSGVSNE